MSSFASFTHAIKMRKCQQHTKYRFPLSDLTDEEQAMLVGTTKRYEQKQRKLRRSEYKSHSRIWRATRVTGTIFQFTLRWAGIMLVWSIMVSVIDFYEPLDDYLLKGKQHRFLATFLAFFVVLFTNQAVSRFEQGLESTTQISTAIEQIFVELQGCSVQEDRLVYSECFRLIPPLLTAIRFALGYEDVTKKLKPFVIDEIGKYLYDEELTWVVSGGAPPQPRIEVLDHFKEIMMRRGEESPWSQPHSPLASSGNKQKYRFPLILEGNHVVHLTASTVAGSAFDETFKKKHVLHITLDEGESFQDVVFLSYEFQMSPDSDEGIHSFCMMLRYSDGKEDLVHIGNLIPDSYSITALSKLAHLTWLCNVPNSLPQGENELKPVVGQTVTTKGYQIQKSDDKIHYFDSCEGVVEEVTKDAVVINGNRYPFRNVVWQGKNDPIVMAAITVAAAVAFTEVDMMNAGLARVFDLEKSLYQNQDDDYQHDHSQEKPWESFSPIERAGFLMSAPRQCRPMSYKPLQRKEMKIDNVRELPGRVLYLLNRVTMNSAGGVSNLSIDNVSQRWLDMKIIAETKYPFPLFHISPVMTFVWLLTLPFHLLDSFSGDQRWLVPLIAVIMTCVFIGLIEVGKELVNPFGQDLNDIDLITYEERLNKELCGLTPISVPHDNRAEQDTYRDEDIHKSLVTAASLHSSG
eukprot:TRINITY_DN5085_c0_g1_i3.p1 TRINITY_DN5085_c0_g1~~TRINITY_DN5085_c0_g1_i3.p1  ORF type:complete len:705 (+),score=123.67 TRINITY_DN5085_c0_g1_i3:49-2115(+)